MKLTSVLTFISVNTKTTKKDIEDQILKTMEHVSDGRYLITVFKSPSDWASHLPIESIIIGQTMGGVLNRSDDWEFFGNGVIRTYTSKTLRYTKSYQWVIVRKAGEKPYARRANMSSSALKRNSIPVADKVFTRDVANNVWHLKNDNFKDRVAARFSALLTWQDENFLVQDGFKIHPTNRKTLSLKEDLVGVPNKVPYFWDNGNVLF